MLFTLVHEKMHYQITLHFYPLKNSRMPRTNIFWIWKLQIVAYKIKVRIKKHSLLHHMGIHI